MRGDHRHVIGSPGNPDELTQHPELVLRHQLGRLAAGDAVVAMPPKNRLEYGETERSMPVISMFYGVIVMMYFFDDKQHHLPHIHVEYAEESAVLAIPSGDVLKGRSSPRG